MGTSDRGGVDLQGGTEEARREAASMMGKAKTERKSASSRANIAKATAARQGKPMSEEHKEKLREAYRIRQEKEWQEKLAQGDLPPEPKEKRKPGRPKKETPE